MLTFFIFFQNFFLTSHHFGEIVDVVPNEILKEKKNKHIQIKKDYQSYY